MRIIKFRAWHNEAKAWIHDTEHACNLLGETIILGEWMSGVRLEDLNEVVLEQFTGLLDKNGKEIYEGDILNTKRGVRVVQFEQACFGLYKNLLHLTNRVDVDLFDGLDESEEVIGNIHENPELLK